MKVLLSRDVLKLAQASAVSKEIKTWTWGDRRYNIAGIEKDIPLLLKLLQSDECKGKSINTQARRVLSARESLKTSGKDARVKDLQGLEVLLRSVCAKAQQFNLALTDALLANAIKTFPKVSGRSIRQLLRLGKFLADQRKSKLTLEHLRLAAKYHDFAEEEK